REGQRVPIVFVEPQTKTRLVTGFSRLTGWGGGSSLVLDLQDQFNVTIITRILTTSHRRIRTFSAFEAGETTSLSLSQDRPRRRAVAVTDLHWQTDDFVFSGPHLRQVQSLDDPNSRAEQDLMTFHAV